MTKAIGFNEKDARSLTQLIDNGPSRKPRQSAIRDMPGLFPVTLEHDGGSDGTATTEASWTYRVVRYDGTEIIEALVNPGIAPHEYRRGFGKRGKATSGLALMADGLIIFTTNETLTFSTCE